MIAISAGHFGKGTGAIGIIDEVEEAVKVVEQVTKNLQQQLKVTKIIDTRSKNQRQNLTYLRQQHDKAERKVDVLVHFNATSERQERALGTEVLYRADALESLAAQLSAAISSAAHLKNRGAKKRHDLFMLNTSDVGAVLIEVCFVNSTRDVQLYQQYFHQICRAISDVLYAFVTGSKKTPTNDYSFSSSALQQHFQQLMNDQAFKWEIVERAIAVGAVQPMWRQRLNLATMTKLDFCTIALLLLKK